MVTCINLHLLSYQLTIIVASPSLSLRFVLLMSSKVLNNLVIAVIVNNAFARAEQAKGSVRHAEAQRIAMCHVILKSLAL